MRRFECSAEDDRSAGPRDLGIRGRGFSWIAYRACERHVGQFPGKAQGQSEVGCGGEAKHPWSEQRGPTHLLRSSRTTRRAVVDRRAKGALDWADPGPCRACCATSRRAAADLAG